MVVVVVAISIPIAVAISIAITVAAVAAIGSVTTAERNACYQTFLDGICCGLLPVA